MSDGSLIFYSLLFKFLEPISRSRVHVIQVTKLPFFCDNFFFFFLHSAQLSLTVMIACPSVYQQPFRYFNIQVYPGIVERWAVHNVLDRCIPLEPWNPTGSYSDL